MKQILVIYIALLVSCIQCHSKLEDSKKKISKYAYRTQHCSREHSKFVREYFARVFYHHFILNIIDLIYIIVYNFIGIIAIISTIIITSTRKMSILACSRYVSFSRK